jgi:trigger factor
MPGFRRGKVPVKMIAQTHGAQVQAEVLSDKVGRILSGALEQNKLRLAGQPQLEAKADGDAAYQNFRATFEVYPEVPLVDASKLSVQRAVCPVGPAEVDKTIEVMRRQRGQLCPRDAGGARRRPGQDRFSRHHRRRRLRRRQRQRL